MVVIVDADGTVASAAMTMLQALLLPRDDKGYMHCFVLFQHALTLLTIIEKNELSLGSLVPATLALSNWENWNFWGIGAPPPPQKKGGGGVGDFVSTGG